MLRAGFILGLALIISPVHAGVTARPLPVATTLTSFSALGAKQALDSIRSGLKDHLAGWPTASLEHLARGLDAVEARLSDRSMTPVEASLLKPEVTELRGILSLARNLSSSADAGRLASLGAALGRDSRGNGSIAGLALAARGSASLGRIFDDNRFQGDIVLSPAEVQTAASRSSKPALSAPTARVKDLQVQVPPLSGSARTAPAAAPAAQAPAPVQPKVERLSKHVLRITDPATGKSTLEIGVADLLAVSDPAARTALSRRIAAEIFAALGRKDDRLAEALADFLRDIADYAPAGAKAVRLVVDSQGRYSLVFERADGLRRILNGQFLPSSGPGGRPGRPGFIVMRPVEAGVDGSVRSEDLGYWREYVAGGRRQEWTSTSEKEEKGWGLWAHQNELQKVWLEEEAWTGAAWQRTRRENVKTLTVKEGKSWLGKAGDKVMDTPVVGHTIKFCDDVGATLFTGISAAPQVLISAVSGSDTYSIEAAGSYAHNPLMRALVDEQGFLDRLTPGGRKELFSQTRLNRLKALQSNPFPLPPDLMRQAVDAPVSAKEAFSTLRADYGMGSYGKRLVSAAHEEEGWKSTALKVTGVATGVFENVGEAVFNPIMWAMMGTGEAAAAIKGTQAFAAGATGAKASLTVVKAAHMAATAAWWGPWLISATDNVGRLVRLTNEGKFDKDYYKHIEDVSADIIYLFLIP
ncbi:MAG: hypothetical protein HY924_00045 [Elusimicrobia bacterium]|nr:hypothetical protein [Elusimicrobiota bacterium]